MILTNLGAALGTLAFVTLSGIGIHQKMEVDYFNAHRPPTVEQLLDNTVTIQTVDSVCSGFLSADDGKIHTAAHCFQFLPMSQDAIIHFKDGHDELWMTDQVFSETMDPKLPVRDHATLVPKKVRVNNGGLHKCSFKPYYGERIYVIGAPLGIMNSVAVGAVGRPDVDGLIEIDARLMPGNSGGPVIDIDHGCVIGTGELVHMAAPDAGVPYGVNFASPV